MHIGGHSTRFFVIWRALLTTVSTTKDQDKELQSHFEILVYLKLTCRLCQLRSVVTINTHVNAVYSNLLDGRRSVTGNVNFMQKVLWHGRAGHKLQSSTMEAAYMALAAEIQEAIWQKMVLQELVVEISSSIFIREDNKAWQMFADHAGNLLMSDITSCGSD